MVDQKNKFIHDLKEDVTGEESTKEETKDGLDGT